MFKIVIALSLALMGAACTIKPGNWPDAKGITVKPGAPVMGEGGDGGRDFPRTDPVIQ